MALAGCLFLLIIGIACRPKRVHLKNERADAFTNVNDEPWEKRLRAQRYLKDLETGKQSRSDMTLMLAKKEAVIMYERQKQ